MKSHNMFSKPFLLCKKKNHKYNRSITLLINNSIITYKWKRHTSERIIKVLGIGSELASTFSVGMFVIFSVLSIIILSENFGLNSYEELVFAKIFRKIWY